jgi:tRNA A64-2'-O-ribosylphosphate transferase
MKRMHICCPDGKDLSVGVALAILCICCDSRGNLQNPPTKFEGIAHITKHFIQQRLNWIMMSIPGASPSRTTLQSINHFLLSELPTLVADSSIALPKCAGDSGFSVVNIFNSLSGKWNFRRTLANVHRSLAVETSPAGTVSGTALFQPRPVDSGDFQQGYLYTESGTMITPEGVEIPVHRRWIWNLAVQESRKDFQDSEDVKICIYFVKPDGKTLDYIYQELEFQSRRDTETRESQLQDHFAIGMHPCADDVYTSVYRFQMNTEKSQKWCTVNFGIDHDVRGPKTDYTSKTIYQPVERVGEIAE